MAESPIVTVCIPTYNRSELLRTSLRSVLWQSLRDVEVVVSDNASTDDTEKVIREFGDPRVVYDRQDTNIGLFANMSRCLQAGSGKYRVVLPDDDLMLPGNLERKVAFLEAHPEAGMVHSAFRFLDDDGRPEGPVTSWARLDEPTVEHGPDFARRSIALGGMVCVSSVMLRSDLVSQERFDQADGPYADMALWLRMSTRSGVGFLPEGLSGLRVHASSASSGFQTVKVRRGKHHLASGHADAIRQAHGRFVDRADLDPQTRQELGELLSAADRKLRLSIAVNAYVPPAALRLAKRAAGWRPGGTMHEKLALDAAAPDGTATGVATAGAAVTGTDGAPANGATPNGADAPWTPGDGGDVPAQPTPAVGAGGPGETRA